MGPGEPVGTAGQGANPVSADAALGGDITGVLSGEDTLWPQLPQNTSSCLNGRPQLVHAAANVLFLRRNEKQPSGRKAESSVAGRPRAMLPAAAFNPGSAVSGYTAVTSLE
jgi:hypothetical protein